jgi:hypothetical protein
MGSDDCNPHVLDCNCEAVMPRSLPFASAFVCSEGRNLLACHDLLGRAPWIFTALSHRGIKSCI